MSLIISGIIILTAITILIYSAMRSGMEKVEKQLQTYEFRAAFLQTQQGAENLRIALYNFEEDCDLNDEQRKRLFELMNKVLDFKSKISNGTG